MSRWKEHDAWEPRQWLCNGKIAHNSICFSAIFVVFQFELQQCCTLNICNEFFFSIAIKSTCVAFSYRFHLNARMHQQLHNAICVFFVVDCNHSLLLSFRLFSVFFWFRLCKYLHENSICILLPESPQINGNAKWTQIKMPSH